METYIHNGLTIEFQTGLNKPQFADNRLIIFSKFIDWNSYQKSDICIDDNIVKVTTMSTFHEHSYSSLYLVYDYGVWNRRGFKDMSVIKNLERVGEKILLAKERHNVSLDFGRSKAGKESLEIFSNFIRERFNIVDSDDLVRFRNWDQLKDVYFTQNTTKATFGAGQDVLEDLVALLEEKGFHEEAFSLKEQLLKALFSKVTIVLDFKERFKKKKK